MVEDGSYRTMCESLSHILAVNNDGKDMKVELERISSEYRPELSEEPFNDGQKQFIIHHLLKEELLV